MSLSPACLAGLGGVLLISACAAPPLGPMVPVVPGPGKPFSVFQMDQAQCRDYAGSMVAGQAESANQTAVGGAVLSTVVGAGLGAALGGGRGAAIGAASGAGLGAGLGASASANAQGGIQFQYDQAYGQCMYSHGNEVPGYPPVAASYQPAYAGGSALVRAVQGELNRLLYMKGAVDGVAGPQTVTAITEFQRSHGLPPDGAPSDFLLDALRRTPSGY